MLGGNRGTSPLTIVIVLIAILGTIAAILYRIPRDKAELENAAQQTHQANPPKKDTATEHTPTHYVSPRSYLTKKEFAAWESAIVDSDLFSSTIDTAKQLPSTAQRKKALEFFKKSGLVHKWSTSGDRDSAIPWSLKERYRITTQWRDGIYLRRDELEELQSITQFLTILFGG